MTTQLARSADYALGRIARLSETRANSYAGMASDVLVSVVLLADGLFRFKAGGAAAALTIACGLLAFTLVEYAFHRCLFHGPVPLFEPGHRKHHLNPTGYDSLPFFLPPAIVIASAVLLAHMFVPAYVMLAMGGLAAGYAAYGLSHRLIHVTRFQNLIGRRWAAIHHIHHHHPDKNFGVTTPLWDILLGTRYVPGHKVKQRR